jgi:DNA-binding response OmpR family regulator
MSVRTPDPARTPRPQCFALAASEAMALMAAPITGAQGEESRKAGGLNGAKILLVEDEFLIALDLQILLYRLGCDVLGPVGSVAEALVLLRHELPDAAVLDINLRDGIVTPVIERLDGMEVPFVLVTARDTSRFSHPRLLSTPALSKPVEERALRHGIESLLQRDA